MIKPNRSELEEYNAYYQKDNAFQSLSRLQQSKWRASKGYPQGKLGSYLELDYAKRTKSNFLTENIQRLVTAEVNKSKSERSLISEPRIWDNLLSSQPLCFNLFGELNSNLQLATQFFQHLFPKLVAEVTEIKFEHSPGRSDKSYTGDSSAFDVFVQFVNLQKQRCFFGIEVKYAECLKEESLSTAEATFLKNGERYIELTTGSIFKKGAINNLRTPPLSQIWRDHLLAISTRKDYAEGYFVFLYPSQNSACEEGVKLYQSYLTTNDELITGFMPRYLDDFINQLCDLNKSSWTSELKARYIDDPHF